MIPLFVSFVLFIFDSTRLLPEAFLPKMGVRNCMIQGSHSALAVYIYIPLTIIISINTLFYAATAWKIYKVHKETSIVREDVNRNQTQANKARWTIVWNFCDGFYNLFQNPDSSCMFDYSLSVEFLGCLMNSCGCFHFQKL